MDESKNTTRKTDPLLYRQTLLNKTIVEKLNQQIKDYQIRGNLPQLVHFYTFLKSIVVKAILMLFISYPTIFCLG